MTLRKLSILFFGLPAFLPLIIALSFQIRQQQVKQRMKEQLETSLVKTIIIPENNIVWIEENEIWVDGKMFDIHEFTREEGNYIFHGLFDEDETQLVKNLMKDNDLNKQESRALTSIFSFLKQIHLTETISSDMIFPVSLQHGEFLSLFIPDIFSNVVTPPPRA
jgi:hypothetical protein